MVMLIYHISNHQWIIIYWRLNWVSEKNEHNDVEINKGSIFDAFGFFNHDTHKKGQSHQQHDPEMMSKSCTISPK